MTETEKAKKLIYLSKDDLKLIKRAFSYVKPHMLLFVGTFVAILLGMVLELFQPLIYGGVIDHITNHNLQAVWHSMLLIFGLMVGNGLISLLETYLSDLLGNKIILDIKQDLYVHILNLPVKAYDELRVGEIISRLEGDVGTLSNIITFQAMRIILDLARIIGIGFMIFTISTTLSWIIILAFPLTYVVMGWFGRILRRKNMEMRKLNDHYYSFLTESFGGVREIKSLNIENLVKNKFMNWTRNIFNMRINIDVIGALSGLSSMWLNGLTSLAVMGVGAYLIIGGYLTLGTYVAFNSYSGQFNGALGRIAHLNSSIQQAMVALERIFTLIDNFMLPPERREGLTPEMTEGMISFKQVNFCYEEGKSVLEDVSFFALPNQMTALVGVSGSGKSTIFNLIMRFYQPESGEITFDQNNMHDLSLDYLREQIALVPQEPFLFNLSIKENLLLARSTATMDEIIDATKKAYIHHYITTLAEGYDTIIGERGTKLSGGQKQRLAIARALLKGSKVLLLDEATSALDGESEEYIQQMLRHLLPGHSILVIAHRLSTIMHAQRIIVIDQGRVAGIGTHAELIQTNPVYQRLYNTQWTSFQQTKELTSVSSN